jgi:hypothetical protein
MAWRRQTIYWVVLDRRPIWGAPLCAVFGLAPNSRVSHCFEERGWDALMGCLASWATRRKDGCGLNILSSFYFYVSSFMYLLYTTPSNQI